ncbi:GCN5-related N-acetyltransferase [uncultured Desulfobacterium sp.]|uniref:GCN5-related N-acetyltransferase n=1 Tax=uncultured Desulfobacterium sp. TaxID=201089 RepID=A0A445MUY5_9BACT|nr:GCN5-related N-acetyltransferase [uncultured Desulfobacterium sp.]
MKKASKNTYWPDQYVTKRRSVKDAINLIRRGQRVYIGSACGEPQALVNELVSRFSNFTDLEIVRLLSFENKAFTRIADQTSSQSFNVRFFYLGSAKVRALADNKRFITPVNLSAVPYLFKSRQLPIHVALIQVSEPDDFGWMSLGVSVDVTLAAAQSADLVIAQINPNMPRVMGNSFIHVNDIDIIVEHEEELLTIGKVEEYKTAPLIAKHVARLVDDGSTLQVSMGASPQALLLALSEKNDLGVHTQTITDRFMSLVSMGVITNKKKGFNEGKMVASGAVGSKNLYEFIHDNPSIEFHPSDYVNDPRIIARHNKMVALNVAMAMDLTGQVAADAMAYNHLYGLNGIMDFIRGATMAPEGKNILILPSVTGSNGSSCIVPVLNDSPIVIPRGDVQYVVTEYGVVNLFGKSLQERAIAMISIAHPDFRDELFYMAKDMGLVGKERNRAGTITSVYPQQIEETLMVNGQRVFLRPAVPTDERRIQEHFYSLDQKDVLSRFMHEKSSFVRDDVADVLHVDYNHDMTIIAVIGEPGFERVIAIGCYFLDEKTNMAEVAYSVDKQWQGKGISTVIQEKLAAFAREHGIGGLIAYTSTGNRAMVRLFQKLPYKIIKKYDGEMFTLITRFEKP